MFSPHYPVLGTTTSPVPELVLLKKKKQKPKRNILEVTVLALLGPRDASKGALQSTAWLECWALGDEELMLLNRGIGEDS